MTTADNKTDTAAPAGGPTGEPTGEPNYDRIAADLMQQWQQQFLKPELTETMGQGNTMTRNLMEMGQVLWQSWLQPHAAGASADKTAYAAADADAAVRNPAAATAAGADAPAAAATGPAGAGAGAFGTTGVQPDAAPAASMASVALCAELARRLDLLSQRVWQLEQQQLNK